MKRSEFVKYILPLILVSILLNFSVIYGFRSYLTDWKILCIMTITNGILVVFQQIILIKRFLYLCKPEKRLLTSLFVSLSCFLFPLYLPFALYVLIKNNIKKSLTINRMVWYPTLAFLILTLLGWQKLKIDEYTPNNPFIRSTIQYSLLSTYEYSKVFRGKSIVESKCLQEGSEWSCPRKWIDENFERATSSGIILSNAVAYLTLFKYKNNKKLDKELKKQVDFNIAKTIVEDQSYFLAKNECKRITPLELTNPVELITSSSLLYAFQLYDVIISERFDKLASKLRRDIYNNLKVSEGMIERGIASVDDGLERIKANECNNRDSKI
jgi:hypothetical protein